MPRRPKWWHTLQASKNEACLRVDLYNRSTSERSLEGFIIHMNLAWLYLLHSRFDRDGIDYRYWDGHRLVRVDGEPKTWGLARCLRAEFRNADDPVRRNVEFFIHLRNKIEHRYDKLLAIVVAGKTQAHMLNYEEACVRIFGQGERLSDSLRFPVFVSSLTPDAVRILERTHRKLPRKVTTFIKEYDASLPDEVQGDYRYDFRVLLLPQTGPKTEADAIVRFVRDDEMTDAQRKARDVVQTIVRRQKVAVQNMGRYKPKRVAQLVEEELGVRLYDLRSPHTSLAALQGAP
jgi:Protein of unknown function (DUF3644)